MYSHPAFSAKAQSVKEACRWHIEEQAVQGEQAVLGEQAEQAEQVVQVEHTPPLHDKGALLADGLPPGWTEHTRTTPPGRKYKMYSHPAFSAKAQSRKEACRWHVDPCTSKLVRGTKRKPPQPQPQSPPPQPKQAADAATVDDAGAAGGASYVNSNPGCWVVSHRARCRIAQDSCFNVLDTIETGSVAVVIMDPPYGITRGDSAGKGWDRQWDVKWTNENWGLVTAQLWRLLAPGGHILIFSQGDHSRC